MNVLKSTSLSPIYSAPVPKTGPVKSPNLNILNDSAKNCQDVLIVGEKCSHVHLSSVRALRGHA